MSNGGNRYRSHDRDTVRQLEKKLSVWQRLFSVLTFLRGAKKLQRWFIAACVAALAFVVLRCVFFYTIGSYDEHSHHIHYSSRYNIINQEQMISLLGIGKETDFASLPIKELEAKLNNHPAIKEASVSLDSSFSLHINITEHVPLLYVEMEDRAVSGKATRLCLSPEHILFQYDANFHRRFMELPVWKLRPGDVHTLAPGNTLDPEICRPVIELACAANAYEDVTELPHILTIERPSDNAARWKLILLMENGTTVEMSALHDIPAQLERLVKALQHARSLNKRIISISVVPQEHVPVIYE